MKLKGGPNYYGVTIGVLGLDSRFPKPPGHIKNAASLDFPVLYETIEGATIDELLNRPSEEFIAPFVLAAKRLEAQGVGAITGSCGFLALYQRTLADAVSIPVFSSSLIQVPLVHQMLGSGRCVGVITAKASSLTPAHLEAVGAAHVPIAIQGMEASTEFREVILEALRDDMDVALVEREVLAAAQALIDNNPQVGAIVLECTDMPPFAASIQARFGLPVFDLTTLASMAHQAVLRSPYPGSMRQL